jgi:3',5'-nucleoside bisphosphate phosphatase
MPDGLFVGFQVGKIIVMARFYADLHIHSCLSPCGDLSSSPRAVARAAREQGLHIAALTDHNSALNAPAFATACRKEGVTPLFGFELTTVEEVHVLALFPDAVLAVNAGEEAYERLEAPSFDPEAFGDQVWVDDEENISGSLEKLLILGTTDFSMEESVEWIHGRGGLVIPAHIDRQAFGALGQLGFLPEAPYDAVECTRPLEPSLTAPWTVCTSSDAHFIKDIGKRRTEFEGSAPDFASLAAALETGKAIPVFENR